MRVLADNDQGCIANCGFNEDRDHLFINCPVFGGLWPQITKWLGFSTIFHGSLVHHLHRFVGLRGFRIELSFLLKLFGFPLFG